MPGSKNMTGPKSVSRTASVFIVDSLQRSGDAEIAARDISRQTQTNSDRLLRIVVDFKNGLAAEVQMPDRSKPDIWATMPRGEYSGFP